MNHGFDIYWNFFGDAMYNLLSIWLIIDIALYTIDVLSVVLPITYSGRKVTKNSSKSHLTNYQIHN